MGSFNLRSSDFPPQLKLIEHVKQTYFTDEAMVTNILELNDQGLFHLDFTCGNCDRGQRQTKLKLTWLYLSILKMDSKLSSERSPTGKLDIAVAKIGGVHRGEQDSPSSSIGLMLKLCQTHF